MKNEIFDPNGRKLLITFVEQNQRTIFVTLSNDLTYKIPMRFFPRLRENLKNYPGNEEFQIENNIIHYMHYDCKINLAHFLRKLVSADLTEANWIQPEKLDPRYCIVDQMITK